MVVDLGVNVGQTRQLVSDLIKLVAVIESRHGLHGLAVVLLEMDVCYLRYSRIAYFHNLAEE